MKVHRTRREETRRIHIHLHHSPHHMREVLYRPITVLLLLLLLLLLLHLLPPPPTPEGGGAQTHYHTVYYCCNYFNCFHHHHHHRSPPTPHRGGTIQTIGRAEGGLRILGHIISSNHGRIAKLPAPTETIFFLSSQYQESNNVTASCHYLDTYQSLCPNMQLLTTHL